MYREVERPEKAIWSTGTWGHDETEQCFLRVQNDGNVIIYSKVKGAIWSTNTYAAKAS
jgi:hypothetical protein